MENKSNALPDIRYTNVMNAPIRKVWDAVATEEGMAAWFMPPIGFRPEEGLEFQLNAGPFGMSPCKVTKVDAPHHLSFLWGKDWTLSFDLKELGDKQTEVTLVHSGWDADKSTEFGQPHTEIRERMDQGWSGLSKALGKYVEA